jgi:hypothetical protein
MEEDFKHTEVGFALMLFIKIILQKQYILTMIKCILTQVY